MLNSLSTATYTYSFISVLKKLLIALKLDQILANIITYFISLHTFLENGTAIATFL